MAVAARQPLNYAAPDLVAARAYKPMELRAAIDHWRSEVQRRRNRLDVAEQYAGMRYPPTGARIETPEVAGTKYRHAMTVLHYLLALEQISASAQNQEST